MVDRTSTLRLNIDPSGIEAGVTRGRKALGGLATAATAAVAALAIKSIGPYREFNSALAEVSTLIEGTAKEMQFLERNSKTLAATFGGTAKDQAEAFYQAISAGAGDVVEANELLIQANRLAVAGVTDVITSVDILTTVTNAYQESGLNAARASDILFSGVKLGKTTIDELSGALGRTVTIASTVGVSFEEVVSSVAALTSVGIDTNQAVTGLTQTLSNMVKPSAEAAKIADELGLEFNAAALESQGLKKFLDEVTEATGGNVSQMTKLFGSVEALKTVLALTGTASDKFNESLAEMEVNAGSTDEAFQKVSESLSQRFDVVLSELSNIVLDIGQQVVTHLVPALEAAVPVLSALSQNMEVLVAVGTAGFLQLIGVLNPWVAALGVAATAVSIVYNEFGAAEAELASLVEATDGHTDSIVEESAALSAVVESLKNSSGESQIAADLKIQEAQARYENIKSIAEETVIAIQSSEAYREIQNAQSELQLEMAQLQKALQAEIAIYGEQGASVGLLKVQYGLLSEEYENNVQKLSPLNAAMNSANARFAQASIDLDAAKNAHAALGKEIGETEKEVRTVDTALGDFIEMLREEHRINSLSAKERAIHNALRKAEASGIKDTNGLIAQTVARLYDEANARKGVVSAINDQTAAVNELQYADNALAIQEAANRHRAIREWNEYKNSVVLNFEEIESEFDELVNIMPEKTATATGEMEKIWDNMVGNMQKEFGDVIYDALWEDGIDSFGDFGDAIVNIWKRAIAEMVAAWATSALTRIFSGGGGILGSIGSFLGGSGGGPGGGVGSIVGSVAANAAGSAAGGASSIFGAGGSIFGGVGKLFSSIFGGGGGAGAAGAGFSLGGALSAFAPGIIGFAALRALGIGDRSPQRLAEDRVRAAVGQGQSQTERGQLFDATGIGGANSRFVTSRFGSGYNVSVANRQIIEATGKRSDRVEQGLAIARVAEELGLALTHVVTRGRNDNEELEFTHAGQIAANLAREGATVDEISAALAKFQDENPRKFANDVAAELGLQLSEQVLFSRNRDGEEYRDVNTEAGDLVQELIGQGASLSDIREELMKLREERGLAPTPEEEDFERPTEKLLQQFSDATLMLADELGIALTKINVIEGRDSSREETVLSDIGGAASRALEEGSTPEEVQRLLEDFANIGGYLPGGGPELIQHQAETLDSLDDTLESIDETLNTEDAVIDTTSIVDKLSEIVDAVNASTQANIETLMGLQTAIAQVSATFEDQERRTIEKAGVEE